MRVQSTGVDIVMPQMGVSVTEGAITRWLKQVGDDVREDETLLEISTDKVDTEVPSPTSGVLTEIFVEEGRTVEVGTVLARISDENAPASSLRTSQVERASEKPKPFVSPVVMRIAREHGVDPARVPGSGRGGRVTKKDILASLRTGKDTGARPPAGGLTLSPHPSSPASSPLHPQVPGEIEVPMSMMRRGIAEHVRRSLDTSAHVTSAIEVDMSRVAAIRAKLKPEFESAYGVNPTYLAFVAQAAVGTLVDYPYVNGEIRGDKIVTRSFVNLGFAVEIQDGGLVVPVVRDAQKLNLLGLATAIDDIAARARSKRLTPESTEGGTFTITNVGAFGVVHGTPVINQPQAAILGVYAIVKRPWVVADSDGRDAIAVRQIMVLTLTYDHRILDGALAGRFLRDLRHRLETADGWGGKV